MKRDHRNDTLPAPAQAQPQTPARRGVGTQALALAASTGSAQVLVAVIYVVAARDSSPAQYGLIVAAIAIGIVAAGFLDFGTNTLWVRELTTGRLTTRQFGARLLGKLIIAAVICLFGALAAVLIFPQTALWMAAPVTFCIMLNQSMQVALRGARRAEVVALSIVTDRLVAVGAFFVLIALGGTSRDVLWAALSIGSLAAAATGWLLTPVALRPRFGHPFRRSPYTGSRYFGVSGLAVSAQSLDLPLLGLVGGAPAAGIYGAVNRWTQPLGLLAAAFASAAAPFIARSGSVASAARALRAGVWLPVAALALCGVMFVIAPVFVPFVLGDAYAASVDVLRILCLVSAVSILSAPLLVGLQALGRERFAAAAVAVVVSAQLALVATLGSAFGATGIAWASLSAQLLLLTLLLLGVTHEYRRTR
ncbi:lipopolysaccharide biosynthesis protein [Cryobacterium frigoriphilum]|uniref:Lipopolysaccharide biosynthesis protein n=1 Tax=Cryobacterium frigoriphilum TaxID=1259150 RepID=A0A4R9A090_9MICO|nr:lipopolysaccharide biosynthesis protein [Cryobacterium frigoriphilum]TFD49819.1 lipopolysaccharide biosynthesis protein [Cryobacterium frigoriphilum]